MKCEGLTPNSLTPTISEPPGITPPDRTCQQALIACSTCSARVLLGAGLPTSPKPPTAGLQSWQDSARRNLAPHCGAPEPPTRPTAKSLPRLRDMIQETVGLLNQPALMRRPSVAPVGGSGDRPTTPSRVRINPRQVVKERITPIHPSRYCRAVVSTRPISIRADDEIRDRWQHGFSAASLGNSESQVIQSRTSVVMRRGDHRTAIYRTFTCEGQSQFDENTKPFPPRIGFDDGGGVT